MTTAIVSRLKRCTKCLADKAASCFTKDSSKKDGLYPSCKECYGDYYSRSREQKLEYKREYRKRNGDVIAMKRKRWYRENTEHCLAYAKAYQSENPLAKRASEAKRRAAKRGSGGSYTKNHVDTLLTLQRGRCAICKSVCKERFHVDHVTPLSKGGANDFENIQILCPGCNMSKKDKDPIDHMQRKGFLL